MMAKQILAVLVLLAPILVSGDVAALHEDVDQDGEVCLNALQVDKVKAHSQQGLQKRAQEKLDSNSTEHGTAEAEVKEHVRQYPSSYCWQVADRYVCGPPGTGGQHPGNLVSTRPIDTLDRAKYECANNLGGFCAGVYYNTGYAWPGAQYNKYYLCSSLNPLTYESEVTTQKTYVKGRDITPTYYLGGPPGCEVPYYR